MSISNAQFKAWLQDDSQLRCTLARITFCGAHIVPIPFGIHAAEHYAYVSNMIYAPPSATIRYSNFIAEVPTITESMSEQLDEKTEISFSNLVLTITDNAVRKNWLNLNVGGRQYIQYLGHPSWDFADFRIVLMGVLDAPEDMGNGQISFPIIDRSALLDKTLMLNVIGGTGPHANDIMPLIYGSAQPCLNVAPKLYNDATLNYQLSGTHTGGITEYLQNVDAVRDAGIDLSADIELVAYSLVDNSLTAIAPHNLVAWRRVRFPFIFGGGTYLPTPLVPGTSYFVHPSGLTATVFKLAEILGGAIIDFIVAPSGSLSGVTSYTWTYIQSSGQVQLDYSPVGQITCDVRGIVTGGVPLGDIIWGGTAVSNAGEIIEAVLTSAQTNSPFTSADIDATSLSAFKALCPQPLNVELKEQTTFSDFIDRVLRSVGGWKGFDPATGKMIFGRLDLPTAGTPVYSFGQSDINGWTLKRKKKIPPKYNVRVKGQKNWTVQTDGLAGAVTPYNRAFYGREFYIGIGVVAHTELQNSYLLGTYPDPQETLLALTADVDAEATRIATMYLNPTEIWSFETSAVAFLLKRGDLIYVDADEFTGYGIITNILKSVESLSTIDFFTDSTGLQYGGYFPDGDLND